MRKIESIPSRRYGPVKLYLDDIASIIDAFQQLSADSNVTITIGGYECSGIEEVASLKQKEHDRLEIEMCTPSPGYKMNINVEKDSSRLLFLRYHDLLRANGLLSEVERIIKSRVRKWKRVEPFFNTVAPLGTSTAFFIAMGQINQQSLLVLIGLFFAALIAIGALLMLATGPMRSSKVILSYQSDESTYWMRNKDKIITTLISSSITFILGIIATLIVQSIGK